MGVQAFLCEESFGHPWLETIQQHSPFEKMVVDRVNPRSTVKERVRNFFLRSQRPVTLHERIWRPSAAYLKPLAIRSSQARFMVDVGWRLALIAVVGLTVWLIGDAGSAYVREEQAWEKWKTDATAPDENYMHFRAETPEVIAEWWETLEHQVFAPETLVGGFT